MGDHEGGLWYGDKWNTHLKKLNAEFGDLADSYAACHAFISSTVPEDPTEDYDEGSEENWSTHIRRTEFPGEFSIKKFYETLEAELESKN